jgi:hypothetical protein
MAASELDFFHPDTEHAQRLKNERLAETRAFLNADPDAFVTVRVADVRAVLEVAGERAMFSNSPHAPDSYEALRRAVIEKGRS